MQIPTYKIMISNVGQIRGESVSSYNCENYFFVIVTETETEFQKNISLIKLLLNVDLKFLFRTHLSHYNWTRTHNHLVYKQALKQMIECSFMN